MKWLGGLLLAAILVVGLFTLFGQGPSVPGLTPPASTEDSTPGYSADDARLVRTDGEGRPLYQLQARRLDKAAESGDVTANDLTLDYTAPVEGAQGASTTANPWKLTALRGDLPNDSRQIRLTGNVRLLGKPAGARDPLRVETQSLDFDMEQQIARTKLPTNFYWGTSRLSTRGLTADLKRGTMRLESSVHGRFLP